MQEDFIGYGTSLLTLAKNHIHSEILEQGEKEYWKQALPLLFDEFQRLLLDAMDLASEVGLAHSRDDLSYFDLPSISPHWQNRRCRDWVILIELLRDSWLSIREADPEKAAYIASEWFNKPYPVFKRLAFFAASYDNIISPSQWVDWLGTDESWWLWSIVTKREVMRLLVLQGANLSHKAQKNLEAIILQGPPRSMFVSDITPDDWKYLVDHGIWLRLEKLKSAGVVLTKSAQSRLAKIIKNNPEWKLANDERDEFSSWTSGTGDPGYRDEHPINIAPIKRKDLVEWLRNRIAQSKQNNSSHHYNENTWMSTCQKHLFNTGYALFDLATETHERVIIDAWNEAFHAWCERKLPKYSWRYFAKKIQNMPDEFLQNTIHSIPRWLYEVAKSLDKHEDVFWDLCERLLNLSLEDGMITDYPIDRAINHPAGQITEALLNLYYRHPRNDNDGLPEKYQTIFTRICDTGKSHLQCGRVILASCVISLFRIDQQWTQEHLLPLFDWATNETEAQLAWSGFLRDIQLYWPFLSALKSSFLDTARHYDQLGHQGFRYAQLLTYVGLEATEDFSEKEIRTTISKLPQAGLEEVIRTLVDALKAAGTEKENYWDNRVASFWKKYWPKDKKYLTKRISESLVHLCVEANTKFPDALAIVKDWLLRMSVWEIIYIIRVPELLQKFPKEVLTLLDAVIDRNSYNDEKLGKCLDDIAVAKPCLKESKEYQWLREFADQ